MKKFLNAEMIANTALKFGSMGIGILMIRFFAGQDAMDIWGSITLVIAYSSVISIVTQFGQGTYLLKQEEVSKKLIDRVQFNSFLISAVLVIAGFLLSGHVKKELEISLLVSPVYVWYKNYTYFYQRKENNKYIFSILNQNAYINFSLLLVTLVLIFTDAPLIEYPLLTLAFLCLPPIVYFLITIRKNVQQFDTQTNKSILVSSVPFFVLAASSQILSWTDTIMIGTFLDDETVGYYNSIFKISSLVTLSLSLMNAFVAPRIRRAYVDGINELKKLVQPYNRLGFVLSFISYAFVYFFAPFVFNIMKIDYSDYLFHSLLILALGYLINAAVGSVGLILQLSGHAILLNKIMIAAVVCNIVANLIFIPTMGIMGAAIASTTSMAFWNIACFIAVKKKLGFSPI